MTPDRSFALCLDNIQAESNRLGDALERMIAIQAEAYPAHWPKADKRELAAKHLFGERS